MAELQNENRLERLEILAVLPTPASERVRAGESRRRYGALPAAAALLVRGALLLLMPLPLGVLLLRQQD